VVGLSAAQVGLGLTVAGVVQLALAVPLGKLADRFGARRTWAATSLLQALLFAAWMLVGGFVTFLLALVVLDSVESASRSARNAYRLDVFPREQRVHSQAWFRAARNVGYTLGALLAGLALAAPGTTFVEALPVACAAVLLANAFWVIRLPATATAHHEQPLAELSTHRGGALRNRGFLAMAFCDGVLGTHQVLLNTVIPLWLVEETDAPRVLLAWLFGTNTVLAVLLQVRASRGVVDVATSLRAQRRGAALFVLSCLIVLVTHSTLGWVTIALVWVGHVTVTGAELFNSAGAWGLVSELSDARLRGEYQGAYSLGMGLGGVWAPAAYTFLAMHWGTPGWLLIALLVVLAAVAISPAARAAERYLAGSQRPVGAAS